MADGLAGVLNAPVLTVHAIGTAYAAMAHIDAGSGVEQSDRPPSNVPRRELRLHPAALHRHRCGLGATRAAPRPGRAAAKLPRNEPLPADTALQLFRCLRLSNVSLVVRCALAIHFAPELRHTFVAPVH